MLLNEPAFGRPLHDVHLALCSKRQIAACSLARLTGANIGARHETTERRTSKGGCGSCLSDPRQIRVTK